jgi:formylmethanofuran dehydrogenase subunit A
MGNWLERFAKAIDSPSRGNVALTKLAEGKTIRIAFEDGEVVIEKEGDGYWMEVRRDERLVVRHEVDFSFVKAMVYWLEVTFQSWRIGIEHDGGEERC